MSQTHAHPAHAPKPERATNQDALPEENLPSVIPTPEQGNHPRSHAAHLDQPGAVSTKPEGNLRQGAAPGELRQPPMVVQRVGKQHRG